MSGTWLRSMTRWFRVQFHNVPLRDDEMVDANWGECRVVVSSIISKILNSKLFCHSKKYPFFLSPYSWRTWKCRQAVRSRPIDAEKIKTTTFAGATTRLRTRLAWLKICPVSALRTCTIDRRRANSPCTTETATIHSFVRWAPLSKHIDSIYSHSTHPHKICYQSGKRRSKINDIKRHTNKSQIRDRFQVVDLHNHQHNTDNEQNNNNFSDDYVLKTNVYNNFCFRKKIDEPCASRNTNKTSNRWTSSTRRPHSQWSLLCRLLVGHNETKTFLWILYISKKISGITLFKYGI